MVEAFTIFAQAHGLDLWKLLTGPNERLRLMFVDIYGNRVEYELFLDAIENEDECIQGIITDVSTKLTLLSVLH